MMLENRSATNGMPDHRVGAPQGLERLPVVGQVRAQHLVVVDRDVGRRHVVAVLGQFPDHRPARQPARSRHADPLCHHSPFTSVTTYSPHLPAKRVI